jgi:hypothetical protein
MNRLAVALVAAAAGCRTGSGAAVEAPAYVVRPTPESRAALAQAVEKALSTQVTIDDDALTRNGVLEIEGARRRDPTGLVLEGRDPEAPHGRSERFHLVKIGQRCVLIHDRTDRRYDLIGTDCAPR